MDIGCNQPEYLNNTFYLEKRLAWSGLAFDPIARYKDDWSTQRSSEFFAVALGAEEGEREFAEVDNQDGWANMMSAFVDKARPEDLRMGYKSYQVQVKRASQILLERGVSAVDFVSIDVEGAEFDVLTGLDLKRNGPKVLLVENARGLTGEESLRRYLLTQGYRLHARIWTCDDVFVKV